MPEQHMLQTILISLLKGVIYQENNLPLWTSLLQQQFTVIEYFKMIGLELYLDESEGYAFLRQFNSQQQDSAEAAAGSELPQLIVRRQLNYLTSLLAVLLRKKLLEHDTSSSETRLIISKEEIVMQMSLYLPEKNNQVKTVDQIESCINKLIDLGFLVKLKTNEQRYEVRRIIKAFVDAAWLGSLDAKLEEYAEYAKPAE